MWIEEQANGKFKYCERYKEPMTGKTKKVSMMYDKKGPKAEKLMRARLQEKINSKMNKIIYKHKNFCTLLDEYEQVYATNVKVTSSFNSKYKFKKIRNEFKDITLEKIDSGILNKFLVNLALSGMSSSTLSSYKAVLVGLLDYAYNLSYINEPLAIYVKMPKNIKNNKVRTENKYLEREELHALITYLRHNDKSVIADAIEFQSLTGLRFGELSALTFDDYDEAKATININKTYTPYLKKENRIHEPKTKTSIRIISVNNRCIEIIKNRKIDNLERQLRFKGFKRNDFIFSGKTGSPYNRIECNKQLKIAASALGIKKNISTHIFRHTHVSLLAEQNIPIQVIMQRVGHSSQTTTQDIYTHVTNKMKQDAENIIKDLKII